MFFFFTCGQHTFTSRLKGYENVTCQCQNCGNFSGHVFKRWYSSLRFPFAVSRARTPSPRSRSNHICRTRPADKLRPLPIGNGSPSASSPSFPSPSSRGMRSAATSATSTRISSTVPTSKPRSTAALVDSPADTPCKTTASHPNSTRNTSRACTHAKATTTMPSLA